MQHLRMTAALLLSFAVIGASCNQDDDDNPSPTPTAPAIPVDSCRITSVSGSSINATYSYDSQKRLVSISGTSTSLGTTTPITKEYQESNGKILICSSENGVLQSVDTAWLNSQGYVTSFGGNSLRNMGRVHEAFEYDANGRFIKRTTTKQDGTSSVATMTYNADGDLVSETEDGTTIQYTYYPDKLVKTGDYLGFYFQLRYGGRLYTNAHLVKSSTNPAIGAGFDYTYSFDGAGKVSSINFFGNPAFILQQACD